MASLRKNTVKNQHIKSSQRSQTVATGTPPTPRKRGGSENLSGHRTMTEARDMLRDELDGSVVPLTDSNLQLHLNSLGISDNTVNDFLQSSQLYSNANRKWIHMPRSLPREDDMYKPLRDIFSAILAHKPFISQPESPDKPSRMAHYSYSAGVAELHQDNGDKLRAYPDLYISGVGIHFKSKEHFTQDRLPSPDLDPHNDDLLLDDKDFEEEFNQLECDDNGDTTSDVLDSGPVVGSGTPNSSDTNPHSPSKISMDHEEAKAKLKERKEVREKRKLYWSGCASFVEAKLNKVKSSYEARSKTDNFALLQVASYARNCFIAQPTRIFVYSLLITETHFRLFRFDRCGVMRTEWFDYHSNPTALVRVILLISSTDPTCLGLDITTTFTDEGKLQFTMKDDDSGQETCLTETSLEFQALSIRGRATVCWHVLDQDGTERLLKQQFVNICRHAEGDVLRDLDDIDGVAKLIGHQKYIKVSDSRLTDTDHDRRLYRLLLEVCGDTIDRVRSKLAFLKALRSAIQAHRDVYLRRDRNSKHDGYIHRDISINNILYPADNRVNSDDNDPSGYLIDYDMAVSLIREYTNAGADFRTGTHAFQSIIILETQDPLVEQMKAKKAPPLILHDHLDDLESFIWVFAWVVSSPFRENRSTKPKKCSTTQIHLSFQDTYENAINCKRSLVSGFKRFVFGHGWMGSPAIQELATTLCAIARENWIWKRQVIDAKRAVTLEELLKRAPADYAKFDNAFSTAIEDIEVGMGIRPKSNTRKKGKSATSEVVIPTDGLARRLRTSSSKRRAAKTANEDDDQIRPAKRPRTVSQPQASANNTRPVASGSGSRRVTRSASKGSLKLKSVGRKKK